MMEEQRKESRRHSYLGGLIGYNNRRSTATCVVRNLAASGARLEFLGAATVPTDFELSIPARGRCYRAQVRWRGAGEAGVSLEVGNGEQDLTPLEKELAFQKLRRANIALRQRAARDGAI